MLKSFCEIFDYSLSADNALYRLVSSDHAPSEVREGAWLHEVRDVYCKEVKRRGSLPNDCESHDCHMI